MSAIISITFSLLTFIAIIYTPILTALVISVAIAINRPNSYKIVPVLLITLFTALNLAKEPAGDFIWYSQHYIWLENGNFLEYFGNTLYGVSAKLTEPVYYIYTKILSVISYGNLTLFVISTTIIIYYLYYLTISKLSDSFYIDNQLKGAFLVAGLTLCITFTLTNHLIRQYIASAIFILAISYAYRYEWKKSFSIAIISLFTHNTIVIPIAIAIIALFISHLRPSKLKLFILYAAIPIPALLGDSLVKILATEHDILSLTDGSISIITLFFDVALIIGLLISYQFHRYNNISDSHKNILRSILLFYALYISFLAGVSDSPLLLLRYYFYIEPMRVLAFLSIIKLISYTSKSVIRALTLTTIILLGSMYTGMRVETSPFNYGMKLQNYISEDMYNLLIKYKIRANTAT